MKHLVFYVILGSTSTTSYPRTSSTLTSAHRGLTSRAHVTNNLESSLILANAGVTSATALHATILAGTSSYNTSSETMADSRLNLEVQRHQRRRL